MDKRRAEFFQGMINDGALMMAADGSARRPESVEEYAEFFLNGDRRRITVTQLPHCVVSTVFLVVDHAFREPPGVWWETMVFSAGAWAGKEPMREMDMRRYRSVEAARKGHAEVVEAWRDWAPGDPTPPEAA